MARELHRKSEPTWLLGTKVQITFTDGKTAEGVLIEQRRVVGSQGGRPIYHTDTGPFHYPHVRYRCPYTGKDVDRPFPEHQITVLELPDTPGEEPAA